MLLQIAEFEDPIKYIIIQCILKLTSNFVGSVKNAQYTTTNTVKIANCFNDVFMLNFMYIIKSNISLRNIQQADVLNIDITLDTSAKHFLVLFSIFQICLWSSLHCSTCYKQITCFYLNRQKWIISVWIIKYSEISQGMYTKNFRSMKKNSSAQDRKQSTSLKLLKNEKVFLDTFSSNIPHQLI